LAGRICEVKSRAHATPLEPIKSKKKIALKLRKWRKSNSRAKIADIHDIAGTTVVCPYPSDVDFIKQFLIRMADSHKKEFVFSDFKPIDRPDYHAFHTVADGQGRFLTFKCELQLKTLFTQSWGGLSR
jgi:ppGpp synthetase/RelA/SpoT-type nucleotidyltranferase